MEHWGLITFRETALLYNETDNSAAAKKRVALVVAHEIAHQWFGNLGEIIVMKLFIYGNEREFSKHQNDTRI